MLKKIVFAVCFSLGSSASTADVLTRCGPSDGHSYFFPGPLVSQDDAGWAKDGISKGAIELVRHSNDFDVIITDTVGTKSLKGDGFIIVPVPQPGKGDFVTLVAFHQATGVVEHYMFQLDQAGDGTLVWGSLKGGGALIKKSALFLSSCHSPRSGNVVR